MHTFFTKTLLSLSILLYVGVLVPVYFVRAQAVPPVAPPPPPTIAPAPSSVNKFVPLTNLPGLVDDTGKRTLADYINVLYRLSVGIGAFLALIQITFAGIKYMSSDAFSSKEEAKKDITSALLGLLLILSTVVILGLIYPGILNLNILSKLKKVEVQPQVNTQTLPTGSVSATIEDRNIFSLAHPELKILDAIYIPSTPESTPAQRAQTESWIKGCKGTIERIPKKNPSTFGPSLGVGIYCVDKASPSPNNLPPT